MDELKPCPFCGNKDISHELDVKRMQGSRTVIFQIRCTRCGIELVELGASCVDRAIRKWNRRTSDS